MTSALSVRVAACLPARHLPSWRSSWPAASDRVVPLHQHGTRPRPADLKTIVLSCLPCYCTIFLCGFFIPCLFVLMLGCCRGIDEWEADVVRRINKGVGGRNSGRCSPIDR